VGARCPEDIHSYFHFAAGGKETVPGLGIGREEKMKASFSFSTSEPIPHILMCHPGGGTTNKKEAIWPLFCLTMKASGF
jgi:hypothetical protein